MYKYILLITIMFSGCSNIEFNAAMCDKIESELTPDILAECRDYNEEEAQKAFDKTKTSTENKEDLKFQK
ncbi:MAG: hypothetical protein L3J10_09880 [Sulfurimonas sp.]|nr:hypothetical protein [Sulfurimonas sp.]